MTTPATNAARPRITVGPTSELSLSFHVQPGQQPEIREAINTAPLLDHAGDA